VRYASFAKIGLATGDRFTFADDATRAEVATLLTRFGQGYLE
jgi:hypothetical protein